MSDQKDVPVGRLILVPALVTLGVTMLRLLGELRQWSPSMFSREAGGAGALVGIVWLIPLVGAWLGLRLSKMGAGPESARKAFGWAWLAFVLNAGLGLGAVALFTSPVAQLAAFFFVSWLATMAARPGWPALWRVLFAYALAARIPVLVIMALSIFGQWDTHYAKPRPDFPAMGPAGLFFWTALLPQMSVWICLTVVGGLLFGALAVGLARLLRGDRPAPSAAAP